MPTGIWTNEGIAKINWAIAQPTTLPINKFVLSGAATVGGVTDPFVEDANLTEATFPDEIYRADTDQVFIDGDGYLVVDSEILASLTDEFYANGIGLIYDDGLGNPTSKTLLAVAALPLQGRAEGVFTRYRFKLPLSGQDEGLVINYNPDDHVTPTELDAAVAGHGHWNSIINGCCRVAQGTDYILLNNVYNFGKVDLFEGLVKGTSVDAGTLTQKLDSGLSRSGFSIHFSGVTIVGSGELYLRHQIFSADAKHFKNQKASFSARILHDAGSALDYKVYVRKANSQDDFSGLTVIAISAPQSIGSGVNSDLNFENIDMGDCSNGIEIVVGVDVGAITTKNFEFAELQLEVGDVATDFDLRPIIQEKVLCQRPAISDYSEGQHDHSEASQGGNARGIIQVVKTQTGAVNFIAGAAVIPKDNSKPQKTEGEEFMTLAITPTDANNTLMIKVVWFGAHSAGYHFTGALFQDDIADNLACGGQSIADADRMEKIVFTHFMPAGTTLPITLKVRVGASLAGDITFNGEAGAGLFDGTLVSSIEVTELKP